MLEKLRAKPDHIKKSISLTLTIVIFSGIVFVWFSSWDARMHEGEIREKTVTPLSGFTTMIDGFVSGIKTGISSTPTYVENPAIAPATTTSATSTTGFDLSGVVIIDSDHSTSSIPINAY